MSGAFRPLAALLVALLVLAGCKSAEERAEEYYQSGRALIESGDPERGMVELRNVFEFDGSHRDARFLLATTLLETRDNVRPAYGQLLRLAEQYPDDAEVRILLAELAFEVSNWEELERHGARAIELAPEEPRVEAIAITLAYREAVRGNDDPARRAQAREAEALLATLPDNLLLRRIVLDRMLNDGDFAMALTEIDWLIEQDPGNIVYWRQRLQLLLQDGDMDGIETQLVEMVERFPADAETKQTLLRFYLSRDETDKAEAFLRTLAAAAEPGDTAPRADLVNFLLQVKGREAALAELDAAIAEANSPLAFRSLRAGILFEQGERTEAITALEGLLSGAEPSDEVNEARIMLARMFLATGNEVGARAQVEQVLAADAGHPMALKMQASWQMRADDPDAAINSLRTALDRAPDDAQAMTLMARAYDRSGRPELAQEFLALAVEASGNAPEESLRYAQLLIGQERFLPAEDVLIAALRLEPRNPELVFALGGLYLRMEDLGRAEQAIATLRGLDIPEAEQAATQLEAQLISQRNGVEEAIGYLESLATSDDATLGNQVELIRARLATGDLVGALALSRQLVADNPDNLALRAINASVDSANGNLDTAITAYREILSAEPRAANVWLELARVTQRRDGAEAANAVVEEALAVVPEDANLLWASASYKEQNRDFDGAIAIYERLYERNTDSIVAANNLASLLATYRDDAESLDRAWAVARRFRDTDIPAMQDTYGWILYRRGESAEAVPYLESAARGLPNDALVQYHLGKAYAALDRSDEALAQFRKAVQIAGPDDQRAQIVEARETVAAARN
jgi:tetratricopeptide (TPR) repeat protein